MLGHFPVLRNEVLGIFVQIDWGDPPLVYSCRCFCLPSRWYFVGHFGLSKECQPLWLVCQTRLQDLWVQLATLTRSTFAPGSFIFRGSKFRFQGFNKDAINLPESLDFKNMFCKSCLLTANFSLQTLKPYKLLTTNLQTHSQLLKTIQDHS